MKEIWGCDFQEFLRVNLPIIGYGRGLPTDYIRRGPIFRALTKNAHPLEKGRVQSDVLLCLPLIMPLRSGKRYFCTLVANLGAFCIQYPSLHPHFSVVTENLADESGQAINNELRNKLRVVVDLYAVPYFVTTTKAFST